MEEDSGGGGKSSSAESLHQPRTASIRARPTSSRITAAELEELFARQTGQSNNILQVRIKNTKRFSLKYLHH